MHYDWNIDKGKNVPIEHSPNTTGVYAKAMVIRMKWQYIYDKFYLASAQRRGLAPVPYYKFVAYRKQYRPFYKKHRKVYYVIFRTNVTHLNDLNIIIFVKDSR